MVIKQIFIEVVNETPIGQSTTIKNGEQRWKK